MLCETQEGSTPHLVTLLHALNGKILTKTFTPDGVKAYDNAYLFQVSRRKVESTTELYQLVKRLAVSPSTCLISGEPTPFCNLTSTRRKKHSDNGDLLFAARPHTIIMVDYDRPRVPGDPDLAKEPENALEAILARGPNELQDCDIIWQLGSSAGIKDKYSLHLFVICDRPVEDAGLKRWYLENGFDTCLADPIQVHYTASPIFKGVPDPVPVRVGMRQGVRSTMDANQIILWQKVAELEKNQKNKEQEHMKALRLLAPKVEGDLATTSDLMHGPLAHLITEESKDGWLNCDCPNHYSSSKKSLHVNEITGQWRCTGCAVSGGNPWDLAMFICKNDRSLSITLLKAATK